MFNYPEALYRLQAELLRLEGMASKLGEAELAVFIGAAALFAKDRAVAEGKKRITP